MFTASEEQFSDEEEEGEEEEKEEKDPKIHEQVRRNLVRSSITVKKSFSSFFYPNELK